VIDAINQFKSEFLTVMTDLDNQLNLLFQNLKSFIVTQLIVIENKLIDIEALIDFNGIIDQLVDIQSLINFDAIIDQLVDIQSLINFDAIIDQLVDIKSLINFDLIIVKLDEIKLAIEEIDLQVDFSTIITTIDLFKSDMIFRFDLALTELLNIKTELINIKSLINFDLIIVKLNEIKLAIEGIDLQVDNLTIDFSPVLTAINQFRSDMNAKFDTRNIYDLINLLMQSILPSIHNALTLLIYPAIIELKTTIINNLTNIQLILNNNFNLILQSFTDLKLSLDLINQKLDLIFQELGDLNIDFLPITTKLNEIKLELNLTNIWAERIYDLLKPECVSYDPGLSLIDYNNLPELPPGDNYCPFPPEEPPPEEELTQCPIDLWEKPPFPIYLMNEAIHRFPLDLVAGTAWPAPTPAADNNIEFFNQEININWLISGIDFLKYPALVSFLIWVIVAL
jgi:hypothetical protein